MADQIVTSETLAKMAEIVKKVTGQSIDTNLSPLEYIEYISNYLGNIIAEMPENVYWVDLNGTYLGTNNNLAKLAGYESREAMAGKTDYDLPWKEHAEEYMENDRKAIKSGKAVEFEETATSIDGKQVTVITKKVPLKDKAGNITGILGISIDITERKKLEEAAKQAQEEKVKGMKILGASIAHELRTPLATINNASQGLVNYLPIFIEGYQAAKDAGISVRLIQPAVFEIMQNLGGLIQGEVNSANLMINMLLMNIQETIQSKYELKKISIVDCVNEALARYNFSEEQKTKVKWNSEGTDFSFMGDLTLTTHILFNLLKNALHYIEKKDGAIIEIKTRLGEQENELIFTDTGPGILAEFVPHVFERFASKREGGTGVGLAFCQMVMDRYNGNIRCESAEGEYTRFILSFPKI